MDSVKSVPTLFGGGNLRGGDYFQLEGVCVSFGEYNFLGGGAFEQEQEKIIVTGGGSASAGGGGAFQNRSRGVQ